MTRRKVLFVTSWYPTREKPGMGVFVREHAKAVRLYDDVVVLHLAEPVPGLAAPWQLQQETDEALTEGIVTYRSLYRISPIPKTSYFLYLRGVFRAYRHIVATGFRPDILHAHVYDAGVAAVLLGKLKGLPTVITEHFSAFPRHTLSRSEIIKARFAFGAANRVMPVSRALQMAIEQYGIRARFQVVPNAVDTSLFFPPGGLRETALAKRLLFVGSLIPLKGVNYLIQALSQLHQERTDWHLDVVGDGPQRIEYQNLVAGLGLADQVTFHGYHPKADVAVFMRRADIFVLPSLWDNLPCVVMEAMASGLSVVASDVGGIPEMVDAPDGILVPPKDTAGLCEAIRKALAEFDPSRRSIIARSAGRFSLDAVGATFHDVYESCL